MRQSQQWKEWLPEGFGIKISCHSQCSKEEAERYGLPTATWNTYLWFADALRFSKNGTICPLYTERSALVDRFWQDASLLFALNWNGGQTFFEKSTHETDSGLTYRTIEIGDDYGHSWDCENRKYEIYDLEYMQIQIRNVASELIEAINLKPQEV